MDHDDWGKKRIEDHLYRREGTIMGDLARKQDESFASMNKTVTPAQSSYQAQHAAPQNQVVKNRGEFFPGVDRWFDNHLSQRMYRFLSFALMIIGTFLGISYAATLEISTGLAGVLGALAGLILIPALILSVKLLLIALCLGLVAGVVYIIHSMI